MLRSQSLVQIVTLIAPKITTTRRKRYCRRTVCYCSKQATRQSGQSKTIVYYIICPFPPDRYHDSWLSTAGPLMTSQCRRHDIRTTFQSCCCPQSDAIVRSRDSSVRFRSAWRQYVDTGAERRRMRTERWRQLVRDTWPDWRRETMLRDRQC